jgi:toxin YoeB
VSDSLSAALGLANLTGNALRRNLADRRTAKRLLDLVEAILRDPFVGIGKPEPLKCLGSDVWSRRLTQEHRCVYVVTTDRVDFLQGRYHF